MALELAVSKFSFQYREDAATVLQDINVTVPAGSISALLGPSNSGKTTLLQAVAGVLGSHHREAVAAGTIRIGNESFDPFPRKIQFPTVGLTSHEPYFQISGLRDTVAEEIGLTLEALGFSPPNIQSRVIQILENLGLSHLSHRKPSTLSGGELQRVALANILIAEPQVLLLDEPSNSLDGISLQRLASIVHSFKGKTTVLISDCQVELAIRAADRFIVLDSGRIVFDGNRMEFIEHLGEFRLLLPVETLDEVLTTLTAPALRKRMMKFLQNG